MITWETYDATRAFERARKRAFLRLAKASILGRKSGMRYSGFLPKEDYLVEIDDLAMLDVEGFAVPLPALPVSQRAIWIKKYNGFCLGSMELCREPFITRLASSFLVLEGGIAELRRLELLRAFGETKVEARMSAGTGPVIEVIEYPERLDAPCRSDRAAS